MVLWKAVEWGFSVSHVDGGQLGVFGWSCGRRSVGVLWLVMWTAFKWGSSASCVDGGWLGVFGQLYSVHWACVVPWRGCTQ